MKQHRVEIDTSKCIGCGICARVCPAAQHRDKGQKKQQPCWTIA